LFLEEKLENESWLQLFNRKQHTQQKEKKRKDFMGVGFACRHVGGATCQSIKECNLEHRQQ